MEKIKEMLRKFWSILRESKLNMGIFIAGVIAFVLAVTVICIIVFRGDGIDTTVMVEGETTEVVKETPQEETTTEEQETTTEEFSTEIDESETTNVKSKASLIKVNAKVADSWVSGGEYFVQYSFEFNNVSGKDIDSWATVMNMDASFSIVDTWGVSFEKSGRKVVGCPTTETKNIETDESVGGGMVVKGNSYVYIDYITIFVDDKAETVKNNHTTITDTKPEDDKTTEEDTTTKKEEETTTMKKEPQTTEETSDLEDESSTEEVTDDETTTPAEEITSQQSDENSSEEETTTKKESETKEETTTKDVPKESGDATTGKNEDSKQPTTTPVAQDE